MAQHGIGVFVGRLWQHARLRALGVDGDALLLSRRGVRDALVGFDPVTQWEEVGEALAGHIMVYAMKGLSRPSCSSCSLFASCTKTENGVCNDFVLDEGVWHAGVALLFDSIMFLDRAYGLDAGELISVIQISLSDIQAKD